MLFKQIQELELLIDLNNDIYFRHILHEGGDVR